MTRQASKADRLPGRLFSLGRGVGLRAHDRAALRCSIVAAVFAWAGAPTQAAGDVVVLKSRAFDAFTHRADARCPERRWRTITPGDLDGLQEEFIASLPPAKRHRLAAVNRANQRCGDRDGLSCPTTETLAAFERVELMPAFAAFACAQQTSR